MEQMNPVRHLGVVLDKYKHVILVLLIGLALMLLPGGDKEEEAQSPMPTEASSGQSLESRLEQILSRISGAGEVVVLLTEQTGAEIHYQTDTLRETDPDSSRQTDDTVLVDQGDLESGLIRRTDPPVYLGAVIVCQGGDDPTVRLAIVEAVRCATGLGANQISVIKMN